MIGERERGCGFDDSSSGGGGGIKKAAANESGNVASF